MKKIVTMGIAVVLAFVVLIPVPSALGQSSDTTGLGRHRLVVSLPNSGQIETMSVGVKHAPLAKFRVATGPEEINVQGVRFAIEPASAARFLSNLTLYKGEGRFGKIIASMSVPGGASTVSVLFTDDKQISEDSTNVFTLVADIAPTASGAISVKISEIYGEGREKEEGHDAVIHHIAKIGGIPQTSKLTLAALNFPSLVSCFDFKTNIGMGDRGDAVLALHDALGREGIMTVPELRANLDGDVRNIFGDDTKLAVIKFQNNYKEEILVPNGLTTGNGFVGRSTRAQLNALYGCAVKSVAQGTEGTTVVTEGAQSGARPDRRLVLSLAPSSPTGNVPAGARDVPLAKFRAVTGEEEVNVMDVRVRFLSGEQFVTNLRLFKGEGRFGRANTTFFNEGGNDGKQISARSDNTFTVMGDISSSAAGTIQIQLNEVLAQHLEKEEGHDAVTRRQVAILGLPVAGNILTAEKSAPVPSGFCFDFKVNLIKGERGDAVAALHHALRQEGLMALPELEGNLNGNIRNVFGDDTRIAVTAFQEKYANDILIPNGLTQGNGAVRASTRAKLNALYGCAVAVRTQAPVTSNVTSPSSLTTSTIPPSSAATLTLQPPIQLGVMVGRVPTTIDNLAQLTFSTTGNLPAIKKITITFEGTAPAGQGFLDDVVLIDQVTGVNANIGMANVQSAPCDGVRSCTKTFDFGFGFPIHPASPYSFTLRVNSTRIAGGGPTVSPTLSASIKSSSDVTFVDVGGASGVLSGTTPVRLASVSYAAGTGTPTPSSTPSITVLSPNGGETWTMGQGQRVTWKSQSLVGDVGIYVAFPDGGLCRLSTVPVSAGSYLFSLQHNYQCPNIPRTLTAGSYQVGLYANNGNPNVDFVAKDASDAPFSIVAAGVPVASSLSVTSGPAGTTVTISGANFASGNTVKMGSLVIASNLSSGSGNTVTFTVPSTMAAGTYPVTVMTLTGTSNALNFTVLAPSTSSNLPPRLIGVTGFLSLPLGVNATWNVNASDPEGGPLTYSVNWGDGTPVQTSATNSFTHKYTVAGTYTPSFTVTDNTGLSASLNSMTTSVVAPTSASAPVITATLDNVITGPSVYAGLTPGAVVGAYKLTAGLSEGVNITALTLTVNGISFQNLKLVVDTLLFGSTQTSAVSGGSYTFNGAFNISAGQTKSVYVVADTPSSAIPGTYPSVTTLASCTGVGVSTSLSGRCNAVSGQPLTVLAPPTTTPPPSTSTNRPPTISGVSGFSSFALGTRATWNVFASDPDGDPLVYSVVWGDGTTDQGTATTQGSASFAHTYAARGTFTPTFTVTDPGGLTATRSSSATTITELTSSSPVASGVSTPSENLTQLATLLNSLQALLEALRIQAGQ